MLELNKNDHLNFNYIKDEIYNFIMKPSLAKRFTSFFDKIDTSDVKLLQYDLLD